MLIDKGDVEYLQVIEPIWSTGINWQSFNPLLPDFYKPQKYAIMGRITHVTRLMHFKYKEVPDILKPTYMFQGQPLAQELIPYLMGFEQSRININKLIAKYNHFVLKCNLESIIADNSDAFVNGQNLGVRIDLFNQVATNGNVIAIDKDSEEFENISVNLSGLSEIMNQNIQYVCSIGRIPVNKLFQNSLGGLNPTGEFETTSFRDTIREHRVNIVDHNIQQALELFMIDVYGEIDDDICWEWLPIEESNELEQSQINLNIANELSTLTNAGILAQQQAAQVLVQTEDVKYSGLEIVEENYQNEIDNLDNENEE